MTEKRAQLPEFFYNRTGILAQTTAINRDLATGFMATSALQRNIVVRDSDRRPEEPKSVLVGSDTLAGLRADPIGELRTQLGNLVFEPVPFYEIVCNRDRIDVFVHQLLIDEKVRKKDQSIAEYQAKFLRELNSAVRAGVIEGLFHEKFHEPNHDARYFCVDKAFGSEVIYQGAI